MSHVYKRLLILAVLVVSLTWLVRNADAQSSNACLQCTQTWASCLYACEVYRQYCYSEGWSDCDYFASICGTDCDNAYYICRTQNCGPGGGGGLGCNGSGYGYSQSCANLERGNRASCIAYGSSGSTYQTCMSNYNDPEYCCDQQINADIQANCQCVMDSRNPDCVCNP